MTPEDRASTGAYRSSILRGVIGALVAPFAPVLPVSVLFILLTPDHLLKIDDFLSLCVIGYYFVLSNSLWAGIPTWTILRFLHRESGRTYAIAGGLEGLVWNLIYRLPGSTADALAALAFCAFIGALVAIVFWLIARVPVRTSDQ
jgi:hypothetical protein